jgi:hypothetical protein
VAEYYGNDFIVRCFENGVGSREDQAQPSCMNSGNLCCTSGGDKNYKPNYLSIMNYLFSLKEPFIIDHDIFQPKLHRLDETNLNEPLGTAN